MTDDAIEMGLALGETTRRERPTQSTCLEPRWRWYLRANWQRPRRPECFEPHVELRDKPFALHFTQHAQNQRSRRCKTLVLALRAAVRRS